MSVDDDGAGRSTGGGSRGRIHKMLSVPSNQPRPAPGAKDIGARSPLALLSLATSWAVRLEISLVRIHLASPGIPRVLT